MSGFYWLLLYLACGAWYATRDGEFERRQWLRLRSWWRGDHVVWPDLKRFRR